MANSRPALCHSFSLSLPLCETLECVYSQTWQTNVCDGARAMKANAKRQDVTNGYPARELRNSQKGIYLASHPRDWLSLYVYRCNERVPQNCIPLPNVQNVARNIFTSKPTRVVLNVFDGSLETRMHFYRTSRLYVKGFEEKELRNTSTKLCKVKKFCW